MRKPYIKPILGKADPQKPGVSELLAEAQVPSRRRSKRVRLQMLVFVRFSLPDGREVQQDGYTQAVNAHGGLLEMGVKTEPGQCILLINPKSAVRESCTVIHSQNSQDGYYNVAFAFETPAPHFWSLSFPPEDWSTDL